MLLNFDGIDNIKITDKLFDSIILNRNTQKYKSTITHARMILQNYSSDVHYGENSVIGILFDMNILFEKVVFRILENNKYKYFDAHLKLFSQSRREFWNGKSIRPDIVGEYRLADDNTTNRFIIDIKWKIPNDNLPNDSDLKQMFTYNLHYGSQQSVLVYPRVKECCDVCSSFINSEAVKDEFNHHSCTTYFIDLFTSEEKINKNAGDDLIISLLKNHFKH